MVIKLYMVPLSPPARAVLLTAEALSVKLDIHLVDLAKQENLSAEYKKLNPQHTVPMIDDEGTVVWDSHAIIAYLVRKYGKDDSLYPKDFAKRALVDQRLHFEGSVVFAILRRIVRQMKFKGLKTVTADDHAEVLESYGFLDKFLEGSQWAAGDSVTIADLSLVSSVTSLDTFIPIDKTQYPNIHRWLNNVYKLPYYKVNVKGLEDFRLFIKNLMS